MFCPNCGKDAAGAGKFCPNCGGALPAARPQVQAPPQPQMQPRPQAQPVYQQPQYVPQPPVMPPEKPKKRLGLWIGLSVGLVVLIAAVVVLVLLAPWKKNAPADGTPKEAVLQIEPLVSTGDVTTALARIELEKGYDYITVLDDSSHARGVLLDNGSYPDETADDGEYSGLITLSADSQGYRLASHTAKDGDVPMDLKVIPLMLDLVPSGQTVPTETDFPVFTEPTETDPPATDPPATDPPETTAPSTLSDARAAYLQIAEEYKAYCEFGLSCGWDLENRYKSGTYPAAEYPGLLAQRYYTAEDLAGLFYAFIDLNSDGVDEMLIGMSYNADYVSVLDLYTFDGRQPVELITPELCRGNTLGMYSYMDLFTNGTAWVTGFLPETDYVVGFTDIYTLPKNGTALVLQERYTYDMDADPDNYIAADGSKLPVAEYYTKFTDQKDVALTDGAFIMDPLPVAEAFYDMLVFSYGDDFYNSYHYKIPEVNLPGEEIALVNQQMYDRYYGMYEEAAQNTEYASCGDIDYVWYVNGDVLSLVVRVYIHPDASGYNVYEVYNFSLSENRSLSPFEVAAAAGYDWDAYQALLKNTLADLWMEKYGDVDIGEEPGEDLFGTISAETLAAAKPFLNGAGDLCVSHTIWFPVAGGRFGSIADLTHPMFMLWDDILYY